MKNKKIAFVTPIYLPANLYGSDTFVRVLAEKFAAEGVDTSVITSDALTPMRWYDPVFSKRISRPYERINGVKVYRLACNQAFSSVSFAAHRVLHPFVSVPVRETLELFYAGPALIGLDKLIYKQQYDAIHCSPFPLYINKQTVVAVKSVSRKTRLVLTPFFHAQVSGYHNRILETVLSQYDVIHTVSRVEMEDMLNSFDLSSMQWDVIPLCLDMGPMHDAKTLSADIGEFKKKHALNGKTIVLFAGLKGPMKGAIDVLHAMEALYRKNNSFALVAIGHNGKEWEAAKRSISGGFLVDLGYKKGREKEVVFGACDLFCMPSKSESFGLVYLEAWHKRKPVVAADFPPMRELIQKNNGGILVPYGNPALLGSAIERLASDTVLLNKLGDNGYRAVTHTYTLGRQFPSYKKLFSVV